MIQPNENLRRHIFERHSWIGFFLVVWGLGVCAGISQAPQDDPLPPPENANPLVAKIYIDGNHLFAEHRWTAAIESTKKRFTLNQNWQRLITTWD
jgi:hypothetical protein